MLPSSNSPGAAFGEAPPAVVPNADRAGQVEIAAQALGGVVREALEHPVGAPALVVWDANSELAQILVAGYRRCLPEAEFLDFGSVPPEDVRATFGRFGSGDLVVLVQSTSFRLDAFRIRLELFRRGLKVIEHPHLVRMTGAEVGVYLDALVYDREYYRGVGAALKQRVDRAARCVVRTGSDELVYASALEPARLNVGDYRGMQSVGGQFPIGEVFTESSDLAAVNGRLRIAFFGDTSFRVNRPPEPITLVIEAGQVVATENSVAAFDDVLAGIRATEGVVWIRELGFGMNRALSSTRTVSDIGTFERMCGVHCSLGAKHAMYNKAEIRKKAARFHVDVFAAEPEVELDGEVIYSNGAWRV